MNTWDNTLPEDTGFAGDGDDEIRLLKADLKDRMGMDHHFGGELDPLKGDCEGYHKKVTMKVLDADPTPLTGTGVIYTKLVDDVVELFFMDETTGVVNQLTEQGVLSLNTLQNDLDGNGKIITNLKSAIYSKNITAYTLSSSSAQVNETKIFDLHQWTYFEATLYQAQALFHARMAVCNNPESNPLLIYDLDDLKRLNIITAFAATPGTSPGTTVLRFGLPKGRHWFHFQSSGIAGYLTSISLAIKAAQDNDGTILSDFLTIS